MGSSKSITLGSFGLALALAVVPACGGGGDDDGGGGGGGGDADGGGGGGGDCDDGSCLDLEPPAEGQGFQLRNNGKTIRSGEDVEYCELMQLPGGPEDTYYVNRFESAMTAGSHHLIVAAYDGEPESGEVGDIVECFAGNGFGGNLIDVTGQQLPYHEENFPDGVGRVYHGGQKVVFNFHYLNATDGDLEARAAVNFFTTDEANVQKIAESAGFLFLGIDVDDGDEGSYTMHCDFDEDVMVYKLSRHTHKWGTEFPVYYKGGANDGDLIYTSPSYEDPDYIFEEPIMVQAGDGFRFTCNYLNDSGHHLGFGENATDEMCILFATVYSPTGYQVGSAQGCYAVTSE